MTNLVTSNTVLSANKDNFMEGFLAMCPIPTIPDPKWDKEAGTIQLMVPVYTPENWLAEWTRQQQKRAYSHGKKKLAAQNALISEDIIEAIPKLDK